MITGVCAGCSCVDQGSDRVGRDRVARWPVIGIRCVVLVLSFTRTEGSLRDQRHSQVKSVCFRLSVTLWKAVVLCVI